MAGDTSALQAIATLAAQRELLEARVCEAVNVVRAANRSWSGVGAMLGVSKQAALSVGLMCGAMCRGRIAATFRAALPARVVLRPCGATGR
jgi:hypothetical protein